MADSRHAMVTNINAQDKDDLFLLKTLLASQADYLVSGDNDLLCLKNNYPILTLAEFYELLEQELIL